MNHPSLPPCFKLFFFPLLNRFLFYSVAGSGSFHSNLRWSLVAGSVGVVFAAALFPRAVFPDGRCLFGGGEWILFFNVGVDILF